MSYLCGISENTGRFAGAGLLLLFSLLTSGCGRELSLSVRAAENEKDQPTTALARKIEISYFDPAGQEQVRESLAVLGMGQPVAVKSELLKEVEPAKGGVFRANAYSGDGVLLLTGKATAQGAREPVEIVLGRAARLPSELGSPLLRRLRLTDAPLERDFERDVSELRRALDRRDCLELPSLALKAASGAQPKLVLEAAVKAPSFRFSVGLKLGGAIKVLSPSLSARVNAAGDAELELGRSIGEGLLFRQAASLRIEIHSSQYEGCVEVRTRPHLDPLQSSATLDQGVGQSYTDGVGGLVTLRLQNPNEAPMRARIQAVVTNSSSGERVRPCYRDSNDRAAISMLNCSERLSSTLTISGSSQASLSVYGGFGSDGRFTNRDLRVDWIVESLPEESAGDSALGSWSMMVLVP